jgi:hypothetical protein
MRLKMRKEGSSGEEIHAALPHRSNGTTQVRYSTNMKGQRSLQRSSAQQLGRILQEISAVSRHSHGGLRNYDFVIKKYAALKPYKVPSC